MIPTRVLTAFGATEAPSRLPGGQGETWRAGLAVFKPTAHSAEAEWSATVLSTIGGGGFRVAQPLAASDGRWVVDGWTVAQFVAGEPAGPNGGRWAETIAACEAFHAALVGIPRPEFFDHRDDAWSIADRMAWNELPVNVLPPFGGMVAALSTLLRPVELPPQVIHGDFTANVLFAEGQLPCVIDFSPYWRPAAFAVGVIVADALTWAGADASILGLTSHIPEFPQLLVRAELRRLLELDQHALRGRNGGAEQMSRHWTTVRIIETLAKGPSGSPEAPRS